MDDVQKAQKIFDLLDAAERQRSSYKAWQYAEKAATLAAELGLTGATEKLGSRDRPATQNLRTALKIKFGK